MITFNNIEFLHVFWLLLILPCLFWYALTQHKPLHIGVFNSHISINYPLLKALDHTLDTPLKKYQSRFSISIIFILLLISLSQPVSKISINNKPQAVDAINLILLVNTSISMVLRDYQEAGQQLDRMAKAKQLLLQLVRQFKGDKIALVVLGHNSSVWLPLTNDRLQMTSAINRLQTTLAGRTNDMGAALQLIDTTFTITPDSTTHIVLVNDGYLQLGSESPVEAVKRLRNKGFTLHSLAIGSAQRPSFSLGVGHLIYAPVDLQLMQNLADAGKGTMIHAWNNDAAKELNLALRKNAVPANTKTQKYRYQPLYHYPLMLAILLLLNLILPISKLLPRPKK